VIDGIPLPTKPGLAYYLLYKPVGVLSTADDPQGRPIVISLVPDEPRVFPVGRLDADSEGLLILTNDGDLTYAVTHPRFGVTKTYVARVDGVPPTKALHRLVAGLELEDGEARAVSARTLSAHGGEALVEVVMTQGRKREVRRMLDYVGYPATSLIRTAVGPIRDQKLKSGAWRHLTVAEVRSLYSAIDGAWDDAATDDLEDA
jgi:23S rRNA pseudouridine2605 synthase